MAKWSKKLLGLAAIGSAAAGLVYYLKKSKKNEDDDFNDDFEQTAWITAPVCDRGDLFKQTQRAHLAVVHNGVHGLAMRRCFTFDRVHQ